MTEPEVNHSLAKQFGLLEEEYDRILKILGRKPSYTGAPPPNTRSNGGTSASSFPL